MMPFIPLFNCGDYTTIFALVTDESDQNDISDRYIKSFLWRKASAINSTDFITYINEYGAPRSSVLRVLIENSTKENHEKAATLLNDYPADTKLMMAYLHQQKKEYEPACVLLEHRMLEIAVEMQSILIALTQVSLSENRGDDAEELACIQEQLAKQFGILECTAYTAKLECAINKKDAEYCTKILSLLLASMEGKTDISSNILYKHLNLSDDNMENLPRQLLSSMIDLI